MKIFIILLFFNTSISQAMVNLASGHYFKPLKLELGSQMNLSLTYNSGSKHKGLFGQSWCSELEQNINATSQRLTYCGEAKNIKIIKNKKEYFYKSNNKKYKFNMSGKLKSICDKSSCWQLAQSKSSMILKKSKQIIKLRKNSNKKITEISNNKKRIASFSYKKGKLSRLLSRRQKISLSFLYDKKFLIKINDDKGGFEKIKYKKGFVEQLSNGSGCQEKYKYSGQKNNTIELSVLKKCPEAKPNESLYKISYGPSYKIRKIKNIYEDKELSFSKTKKIISKRDGLTTYDYDTSGKVSKLNFKDVGEAKLFYNASSLISGIAYKYKEKGDNKVRLKYSGRKLASVQTSLGERYKFDYSKGQLKSIRGKNSRLSYNYKNKKLSSVNLYKNKKKYIFKLKNNKSKAAALEVTRFYNSIYNDLGPASQYMFELQGVF